MKDEVLVAMDSMRQGREHVRMCGTEGETEIPYF